MWRGTRLHPSDAAAGRDVGTSSARLLARGGLGGALMALGIVGIGLARRRRLAA
jgi:hypothetical protein